MSHFDLTRTCMKHFDLALSPFDLTRVRGSGGPRTALSSFDLTRTCMRHFDLALSPFDLTRVRGSAGPRTAMSPFDLTRTRRDSIWGVWRPCATPGGLQTRFGVPGHT